MCFSVQFGVFLCSVQCISLLQRLPLWILLLQLLAIHSLTMTSSSWSSALGLPTGNDTLVFYILGYFYKLWSISHDIGVCLRTLVYFSELLCVSLHFGVFLSILVYISVFLFFIAAQSSTIILIRDFIRKTTHFWSLPRKRKTLMRSNS